MFPELILLAWLLFTFRIEWVPELNLLVLEAELELRLLRDIDMDYVLA